MALNFRLFNCDRTFNLDKVEALIQEVATKISRETKIEKTYFPLPRMNELCEELEKEGSHFEYAVFVVHAHESRLSINEKNAGIGYAKVYRALQKVTGDRVLIVIGGDDNYKEERDKSVLSRWVLNKIFSQFTEEYVSGEKGFIFSWEEDHHPIHEEALEFYLDPTKRGTKFVPRPRPPPTKNPEKEVAKKTEQAKLLELMKQEPQTAKMLEQEFPREKNEGRVLPSQPVTNTKHMTDCHPLQMKNQMESQAAQYQVQQASATSCGRPNVHILSFHASQPSVDGVVKVFERVYKEHGIASKPESSADPQINIQDHIKKYKPEYLVLVSEFDNIEDMANFDMQVQRYRDIVKMSSSVGTKLIFIITEDQKYIEGYMSSDAVQNVFTRLNQNIPRSEQPKIFSWNKTSWPTHKEALAQLLTHYGNVRGAPQQYGATKQDPTSSVPYTLPADVPMKRRFYYKASISCGRVVEVLECDPPDWIPDSRYLNDLLSKNRSVKEATIEFKDEGDGRLQGTIHTNKAEIKAKLYKIAEGLATDKMRSILVYSFVPNEETNEIVSNFIHHLGSHELSPCQPIEPASLMRDIKCAKPDYVMFSADADALKDEDEVKTVIRKYEANIKDVIDNYVREAVVIMLFGDKYYKEGAFASKEATQYVRMLTQGIVPTDRLSVMSCQDRPYDIHQEWMKQILTSKGATQSASKGAVPSETSKQCHYRAEIQGDTVKKVLERIPPDWIPDEGMVRKTLQKNVDKERKAYLEIHGNEKGEILKITVDKERKSGSQGAVALEPSKRYYYNVEIKSGQITEVLEHSPPDWKPDEGMVRKILLENKKLKKAYLEIFGNDKGEILKITVQEQSTGLISLCKKIFTSSTSGSGSDDEKPTKGEHA